MPVPSAGDRLHREVLRALTAQIVEGERAAGELLPGEFELARQFGVSRGVARETLRAMQERRLISTTQGRGSSVEPAERWDAFDPDVLGVLLAGERSAEILGQYLECRRVLELAVVGQAAAAPDEARLAPAWEALARMDETTRQPHSRIVEQRFHEADVAFHQALVAATGNRVLGVLVQRIHSALLLARYPLARPQYRAERALPEHRRIMEAVAAGDVAEARAAMEDHLATVARYLREHEQGLRA